MNYKTGIIMMNMGGPVVSSESSNYLRLIFSDSDLINIPFKSILAPLISVFRGKKLAKKYDHMGGGSPILKWTTLQGDGMCKKLDIMSPETAPHKYYVGFRYSAPFITDAISAAMKEKVSHILMFSQYPQYSCTTSGSSFNEAARELSKYNLEKVRISIIDQWYDDKYYINALRHNICTEIEKFDKSLRSTIPIVFSAHSIPLSIMNKGDRYPLGILSTVEKVIMSLPYRNPYHLSYQSKVGPSRWMEPNTTTLIENLIQLRRAPNGIILVPISFTSDHVETLYDIDIKLKEFVKNKYNYDKILRVSSFNDQKIFQDALANVAWECLTKQKTRNSSLLHRCHSCISEDCQKTKSFFNNL